MVHKDLTVGNVVINLENNLSYFIDPRISLPYLNEKEKHGNIAIDLVGYYISVLRKDMEIKKNSNKIEITIKKDELSGDEIKDKLDAFRESLTSLDRDSKKLNNIEEENGQLNPNFQAKKEIIKSEFIRLIYEEISSRAFSSYSNKIYGDKNIIEKTLEKSVCDLAITKCKCNDYYYDGEYESGCKKCMDGGYETQIKTDFSNLFKTWWDPSGKAVPSDIEPITPSKFLFTKIISHCDDKNAQCCPFDPLMEAKNKFTAQSQKYKKYRKEYDEQCSFEALKFVKGQEGDDAMYRQIGFAVLGGPAFHAAAVAYNYEKQKKKCRQIRSKRGDAITAMMQEYLNLLEELEKVDLAQSEVACVDAFGVGSLSNQQGHVSAPNLDNLVGDGSGINKDSNSEDVFDSGNPTSFAMQSGGNLDAPKQNINSPEGQMTRPGSNEKKSGNNSKNSPYFSSTQPGGLGMDNSNNFLNKKPTGDSDLEEDRQALLMAQNVGSTYDGARRPIKKPLNDVDESSDDIFGSSSDDDDPGGLEDQEFMPIAGDPQTGSDQDVWDYFARSKQSDDLFKIVEKKYREKSLGWTQLNLNK